MILTVQATLLRMMITLKTAILLMVTPMKALLEEATMMMIISIQVKDYDRLCYCSLYLSLKDYVVFCNGGVHLKTSQML